MNNPAYISYLAWDRAGSLSPRSPHWVPGGDATVVMSPLTKVVWGLPCNGGQLRECHWEGRKATGEEWLRAWFSKMKMQIKRHFEYLYVPRLVLGALTHIYSCVPHSHKPSSQLMFRSILRPNLPQKSQPCRSVEHFHILSPSASWISCKTPTPAWRQTLLPSSLPASPFLLFLSLSFILSPPLPFFLPSV